MIELMQRGGPVMWFLLAAGLVAAVVFLERLFHLHRAQIKTEDFLEGVYNVIQRGNMAEAISICEETAGPVAYVVRVAVLHYDESKEDIQTAVEQAGLAEVPRLETNLNMLATIAKVAPLAGLLGTIIGMFRVFMIIEQEAPLIQLGDVAGGVMEALITTIAGLAIAIPAYAGYNFLIGRVESIMLDMEKSSIEILSFLTRKNAGKNSLKS